MRPRTDDAYTRLADIASGDIANIIGRLSRRPYITQEVIYGGGEPVQPSEYTGNGDVQEFRYTSTLRDAFLNGDISGLQDFGNRGSSQACSLGNNPLTCSPGWIVGNGANVFVANHDTERVSTSPSSVNIPASHNSLRTAPPSISTPRGTPISWPISSSLLTLTEPPPSFLHSHSATATPEHPTTVRSLVPLFIGDIPLITFVQDTERAQRLAAAVVGVASTVTSLSVVWSGSETLQVRTACRTGTLPHGSVLRSGAVSRLMPPELLVV
jgi:hypothetical protein